MPKVKGMREEADVSLAVRVDMVPMRDDGGYALMIDMLGIQRECRQRECRKRSRNSYQRLRMLEGQLRGVETGDIYRREKYSAARASRRI